MEMICKTCGGVVSRVGNTYTCKYCGNKWSVEFDHNEYAFEYANAWSTLRNGDFEKATELFENIIFKDKQNHEAYWGIALSMHGILYVTDINENKKIPTCNNITEVSFIQCGDVQKAIELAPEEIADSYETQARYIENVRLEWLGKARKEPAYDVFISFKDSDREHGLERTQDSIDAQDLYNALVAEGYNVFFSRISLRNKVSEHYEPYIYNAIKTAKVMIVFGESAEYFNSVWIKNEWNRFRARIDKGEKHKNSLVVAYKNMDPSELPAGLRSRQCLNAADMTFLSTLIKHIKNVINEVKIPERTIVAPSPSKPLKNDAPEHRETTADQSYEGEKKKSKGVAIGIAAAAIIGIIILLIGVMNNGDKPEPDMPNDTTVFGGFAGTTELDTIIGENDFSDENVSYIVNQDQYTCTLERFGDQTATTLVIPDNIDGYTVTGLGWEVFGHYSDLESIELPEAIGEIGGAAFINCTSLREIDLSSIWSIGSSAFEGCTSLKNVSISRVNSIGNWAFKDCASLETIQLPEGLELIGGAAFENCTSLQTVTFPENVDTIEESAFVGCTSLKSVILPEGIDEIYLQTFMNCTALESVYIPRDIRVIADSSFSGCTSLKAVYYGGSYKSWKTVNNYSPEIDVSVIYFYSEEAPKEIGNFWHYVDGEITEWEVTVSEGLSYELNSDYNTCKITGIGDCTDTDIVIPEKIEGHTVKELSEKAFSEQTQIKSIKLPENLERIGARAFYGCTGLTEIHIPESVIYIDTQVFYKAENLSTVYYDGSYASESNLFLKQPHIKKVVFNGKTVPKYILQGCDNIVEIELGEKVSVVDSYAFKGCVNLESVTLGQNTKRLEISSFEGCVKLEGIDLKNVAGLGFGAFFECTALKDISLPDGLGRLDSKVFYGCTSLESITIPDNVKEIPFYGFANCTNLTYVGVPDSITAISGGAFDGCISLETIVLPDSLQTIDGYAFRNCTALKEIVIPDSVEQIGDGVFTGCELIEVVTVPKSVTSFGGSVFSNCTGLKTVFFNAKIETVSSYLFEECRSLEHVIFSEDLMLSETAVTIDSSAFRNCTALKEAMIPRKLNYVEDDSYYNCSSLDVVYFGGNEEEWNVAKKAISIYYNYNQELLSSTVYYYSETQPTEEGNYWHYVDGLPTKW